MRVTGGMNVGETDRVTTPIRVHGYVIYIFAVVGYEDACPEELDARRVRKAEGSAAQSSSICCFARRCALLFFRGAIVVYISGTVVVRAYEVLFPQRRVSSRRIHYGKPSRLLGSVRASNGLLSRLCM